MAGGPDSMRVTMKSATNCRADMPLNVVLVQPEIPPNTGNIIRLCANTGASLHLVKPMGFPLDHSRMRRAGLDYHEFASVTVHENWAEFCDQTSGTTAEGTQYAVTTKGIRNAFDVRYQVGDWLIFGSETRGLPTPVLDNFNTENRLRIPMRPDNRSLNLSNAVAVLVFEAWRQQQFIGGR